MTAAAKDHADLNPPEQSATGSTWIVLRSGFPFGAPEQVLATIKALDRVAAERLARKVFGANTVVRPSTATEAANPMREPEVISAHAMLALRRAQMRRMTAGEIAMARALGTARFPGGRHRGTIRRLHAETFKPAPEISDELASVLMACVRVMSSVLPPEIVAMAALSGTSGHHGGAR